MRREVPRQAGLLLLATVFSVALMFAFIELPGWIDALLQREVGFPGFDPGTSDANAMKTALYVEALHLRTIGYASLAAVAVLVILGLATRRTGWAWLGAFALYLPVFGQFAASMFLLAGLGLLRAGWLPFMDVSPTLLRLGDIVHVPYRILMAAFDWFGWHAHRGIAFACMLCGAFLFTWGVLVWLQARFSGKAVASAAIYRISRHPQYVGWIVWSYGFMLYGSTVQRMRITWEVPSSLPWLLSAMIVVAICLVEEVQMERRHGAAYRDYRSRTPFLLPAPRWMRHIVSGPMRLVTGGGFPRTCGQALAVAGVYTALLVALSAVWVLNPLRAGETGTSRPGDPAAGIDALLARIRTIPNRRDLGGPFHELVALGPPAVPALMGLLEDPDPVFREYAADGLGELRAAVAVDRLLAHAADSVGGVARSAVVALGRIGEPRVADSLLARMRRTPTALPRGTVYAAFGALGAEQAWDTVLEGTRDPVWHVRLAALGALHTIDPDRALQTVLDALGDGDLNVRRGAVTLLLERPDPRGRPALARLVDDPDFEVRFYARQALRRLGGP